MEVCDDGTRGHGRFAPPPDEAPVPTGYGLIGMGERAAAVGGRVQWSSLSGGGFRVRAENPVAGTAS